VADWRWVKLDELDGFAFPRTDQKIIVALRTGAMTGDRGPVTGD
jgi:hypothetical protein